MKAPIKLYEVQKTSDCRRFQSQLSLHSGVVDFILEDGQMKCWKWISGKGIGFHDFNEPYVIVNGIEEMKYQQL